MNLIIFIHKDTTWSGFVIEATYLKSPVNPADNDFLGIGDL